MNGEKKNLGKVDLLAEHLVGTSKTTQKNYDFMSYTIVVAGVEIGISINKEDRKVFELALAGKIK